MATESLQDLMREEIKATGTISKPLRELIRKLKADADKAWDAASEARQKGPQWDTEDARQTGMAHALCAVLGDQSDVFRTLGFIEDTEAEATG